MQYAIDRYIAGKEREVVAIEYYGLYIPRKRDRFFCPECGEPVFWRSRGGPNPDVFYHREKTDLSPECDKRVDGRSDLSLSQRVGLPVYLTKEFDGIYKLNIAFPSLGNQLFEKISEDNVTVTISAGGNKSKSVPINSATFYVTESTLAPIDFVPDYGRNYRISITSSRWLYSVQRKWSDYADGFESQGGVFLYSNEGGKKVRRGDSIAIGQKYLLLSKQFISPYSEINVEKIGVAHLNQQNYCIYTIVVNVSTKNEAIFSNINAYLKRSFGVWLLERTPELVPLWPPVVESDLLSPATQTDEVFCSVISGNDFPKVYIYAPSGANELTLHHENECRTVVLPLHNDISVSVDRKYVGRELSFAKKCILFSGAKPFFQFRTLDDELIDEQSITSKELKSGFFVLSNLKAELYVESSDKVYQRIVIRQEKVAVPPRRNPYALRLLSEKVILKYCLVSQPPKDTTTLTTLDFDVFSKHCHGAFISAPNWLIPIIKNNVALRMRMKDGKIQRGVLTYILLLKEASK